MLYSFKIATRYLTANRGQSLLLVLGVAVGVYVFVFMSALIGGLAVLLIDRTVGSIAHVVVEPADRDPTLLLDGGNGTLVAVLKSSQQRPTLQSAEAYLPILESSPNVRVVVGKLLGNGFMLKGEAVAPVQITGLEARDISAIANIEANLVAGSTDLMLGTAVIGKGLADTLGIGVGQSLVIRSERAIEQPVTIGGIFEIGVAGVDDTAVYLNIRAARVLLDLPEGLSRYEIKLDDLQQSRIAAADIAGRTGLKATRLAGPERPTARGPQCPGALGHADQGLCARHHRHRRRERPAALHLPAAERDRHHAGHGRAPRLRGAGLRAAGRVHRPRRRPARRRPWLSVAAAVSTA